MSGMEKRLAKLKSNIERIKLESVLSLVDESGKRITFVYSSEIKAIVEEWEREVKFLEGALAVT